MKILLKAVLLPLIMAFGCLVSRADAIDAFSESGAVNASQAAVLIIDLKTGDEIASLNADMPLIPASILKAVTTATLLEKLGSKYRYETAVDYTGPLRDGIIEGNIVVNASGDPSVNTRHDPGSADMVAEIVDALLALRVDSVAGTVIVDESAFPGPAVNPTWQTGDLPHAYGTGTHGFNFEDNASGKRSVQDPAAVFRKKLAAAMSAAGIGLGGAELKHAPGRHRLGVHHSEQIDEIMRSCMMRSDNQFAEAMLRGVGLHYGNEGSVERGAREEMKYWKRQHADMTGVNIVDGSGLSRSNRVTARFMADVLNHMSGNPYYASFFPLAGQEGTLRKFLCDTKLEGEVALKTGSMNGIQCYAGYKLDSEFAPTHIVVVILNRMADRSAARNAVSRLLLSVFYPGDFPVETPVEKTDADN